MHTYIHHRDTSFRVRYVNYFVYKKQSSFPVPGLRRPVFLSWLSLGSHVIRPSHFMSPCLYLPSGKQEQPFRGGSRAWFAFVGAAKCPEMPRGKHGDVSLLAEQ